MLNEAILMEDFHNGDAKAFEEIYRRLSPPLLYYLNNNKKTAWSEDILSTAFLKAYQYRKRFRSVEHVKRWMYLVVRNAAIDCFRSASNTVILNEDITAAQDDDTELLKTLLLSALWEAIYKLSPQRQQAIILYFFKGKSTAEVADQLNISPQTALNHKTRGLNKLKKIAPTIFANKK